MSYLKKFEYAIAVEKYGSISEAAEKLNISQPTFSKYLKKIELELGAELFDRSTLPLRLTEAGKCFVAAGRRFLDLDRQLNKQLEEIKSEGASTLRLGISPSRSPYMMPKAVEEFRRGREGVKIVIEEKTTEELSERLASGEVDLIISLLDKSTEGFEKIELFDEGVYLVASRTLSLKYPEVDDLLNKATLISVGKGQAMWQTFNSIIDEMSLPSPKIECQSIESALALVKKGIGAMIAPSYIAKGNGDALRIYPLDSKINRKVCIFYRKEQFLTSVEREFISAVLKTNKNERDDD